MKFISFEDILENKDILKDIDVIINVGDADTAHTGGEWWCNPVISSAIKEFVYNGGGIIGVGAVSYTHLDVYKRQGKNPSRSCINRHGKKYGK